MTSTKTNQQITSDEQGTGMIRIYNTLSRQKEFLQPVVPGKVGIYLCGPTVYDKAHIGHMVGPVIFDTIKRFLSYCGYDVTWVVNITDVDDKLIHKAAERSLSMAEVAEENVADYLENLEGLGVALIDHMPRATESMPEIIKMTETLIDREFAYEVQGDVFFDVGHDAEYGKLTNRTVDDLQGEGGEAAAKKRSAADFALWKAAKPGEPSWESPWGRGRPGWHIECSAMSRGLLGETFDIHGGGLDLIFPHHENEIAQSECCHGQPMAKIWMHNGLLRAAPEVGKIGGRGDRQQLTDGEKLSRSKGAGGLAGLISRHGGECIRFFLLRTHYRSTVLFSEKAIEEAAAGQETFYRFFKRYERITGIRFYDVEAAVSRQQRAVAATQNTAAQNTAAIAEVCDRFLSSMDDDFNTGGAIGDLFELVRLLNKCIDEGQLEDPQRNDESALARLHQGVAVLRELCLTLGLFVRPVTSSGGGENQELLDGVMQLIVHLRSESRKNKNFETADKIRDSLAELEISLEDRAGGTEWTIGSESQPAFDGLMQLLIELRSTAREQKNFATADKIRDALVELRIVLEDRSGGTDWSISSQ